MLTRQTLIRCQRRGVRDGGLRMSHQSFLLGAILAILRSRQISPNVDLGASNGGYDSRR